MPAPSQLPMVAYAVISLVPLAILIWYFIMYSQIGKAGLTGSGASSSS